MCQCDPSLARRCLDPHSASPHLRPAALDVTTPHSPISVSVICISWSRRRLPLRQAGCGPEANQVPRRAAGGRSCRLSDAFLIDFLPLSPRAALYASLARGLRSRRSVFLDSPENLQPSARLLFAEARALPRALPFHDEPPPPPHNHQTRPAPLPHLAPGSPPRPPRQRRRRHHLRPSAVALPPPFHLPPPSLPPPEPPAIARRIAPPPRRWRSYPGTLSYHRGSPAPGRAWGSRGSRGPRRSSPPCCRPRVASAPPPEPAAAPAHSSAAAPL
eukprot:scaffold20358_cov73-Phaeocystis_antarctica.AAC.2